MSKKMVRLSKTLQHFYIRNKHYKKDKLACLKDEKMVLHSKQCDAKQLAPRCSFSFHPDRKFCCYGDAAFAKWTYPHLLHCILLLMRTIYKKQVKWVDTLMCSQIKKFSLNKRRRNRRVRVWPGSGSVNQVGLKRQLLGDLISRLLTQCLLFDCS